MEKELDSLVTDMICSGLVIVIHLKGGVMKRSLNDIRLNMSQESTTFAGLILARDSDFNVYYIKSRSFELTKEPCNHIIGNGPEFLKSKLREYANQFYSKGIKPNGYNNVQYRTV